MYVHRLTSVQFGQLIWQKKRFKSQKCSISHRKIPNCEVIAALQISQRPKNHNDHAKSIQFIIVKKTSLEILRLHIKRQTLRQFRKKDKPSNCIHNNLIVPMGYFHFCYALSLLCVGGIWEYEFISIFV